MCAWAEIYYMFHTLYDGHEFIKALMSDKPIPHSHILALALYNFLFAFCLSAYLKFSRRYAEEALFAFALSKEF